MTTFAFTALEEAIAHSERNWPITIHLEAELRGQVDDTRLARAIKNAMTHHPMTRVRRQPLSRASRSMIWFDSHPDSYDRETPNEEPSVKRVLTLVRYLDERQLAEARDRWISEIIRLEDELPVRFLLARMPTHDVLLLAAHHAAFDGIGAVVFLRTIAACYAADCGRARADEFRGDLLFPSPSGDPFGERERRHQRPPRPERPPLGATQLGIAGQLRRKASVVAGVLGTSRSARLASVSPTDPNAEVPVPRYHATTMALSAIETQALRTNGSIASSVNGVTLNDVLLAAFHRTLATQAMPSRGDAISVTVPVTQRQPDERHRFVANLTGQATTTSTSEERKTRLVTMQTMRDQTQRIKREGTTGEPAELFSTSILPVRWQARIPKLVSLLTRDRFVATSRLSNLGRHAAIHCASDGFEITHLWFSPPARMPQGLTAGVIVYDEAIHLSLRACHDLWDRTALLDFADRFVDEIRACSLSNESPHRHADAKRESHESVDPASRDQVEAAVTERSQR